MSARDAFAAGVFAVLMLVSAWAIGHDQGKRDGRLQFCGEIVVAFEKKLNIHLPEAKNVCLEAAR